MKNAGGKRRRSTRLKTEVHESGTNPLNSGKKEKKKGRERKKKREKAKGRKG